jgi:hypothetical protein
VTDTVGTANAFSRWVSRLHAVGRGNIYDLFAID